MADLKSILQAVALAHAFTVTLDCRAALGQVRPPEPWKVTVRAGSGPSSPRWHGARSAQVIGEAHSKVTAHSPLAEAAGKPSRSISAPSCSCPGMLYHTPGNATKGQLLHLTRSGQPGTNSNWNRDTKSKCLRFQAPALPQTRNGTPELRRPHRHIEGSEKSCRLDALQATFELKFLFLLMSQGTKLCSGNCVCVAVEENK